MQIRPGPAHTLGGRDLPGSPGVGVAGGRLRARAPVRPETPASGVLLVLACYGERGVARGYAGAAACVCAARGARRRPQPRPPGTPRYQRGLLEGGWTAPGPQTPAVLTRLCPPPQATPARSALGPRNLRRQSPPSELPARARHSVGALPLRALYTAAAVAFVLYKCLQVRDDQGWGCPGLNLDEGAMVQNKDTFSRHSVK